MHPVLRMVSWNIGHRDAAWRELLQHGYDVALLQEAGEPPPDVASRVRVDAAPWRLGGREAAARPWRCVVVGLSDRVDVRHLATAPIDEATREHVPVSRAGTLALAELRVRDSDVRFVVASMDAAL